MAIRVGPPQQGNVQKNNFTTETAGLAFQNKLIEELDFDESDHSNDEEHQKNDYAIVDDSDKPVDESPHKRVWISCLADSNGVWMEVNIVMKKKIKYLSLLWTIIVMHHLMRPPIKKHDCLI